MPICIVCFYETEHDDIQVAAGPGRCVCLRCYLRLTGDEHHLAVNLRREAAAAANREGV